MLKKLFKFLYKKDIKIWYDIHKMEETITIKIPDYKKATMTEGEVVKLKYFLSMIENMLE